MKSKIILFAIASFTLLASCKKTQKDLTSPVNFQFQTQNAGTSIVTWTAGSINATAIAFTITQSGTPVTYKSTISQQGNLFSSNALGNIILPSGTYVNSIFQVTLSNSASASSLHLEGNFNDGTNTVPITFDITGDQMLQVIKDNINMTAGAGYKAVLTLDLSTLLQNIAVTDLASDELSGQVNISSTNNVQLYNQMVSNLTYAVSVDLQQM